MAINTKSLALAQRQVSTATRYTRSQDMHLWDSVLRHNPLKRGQVHYEGKRTGVHFFTLEILTDPHTSQPVGSTTPSTIKSSTFFGSKSLLYDEDTISL